MNRFIPAFTNLILLGLTASLHSSEINLVRNPDFEAAGTPSTALESYDLQGSAAWRKAGEKDEIVSKGIAFPGDSKNGGAVSQMVREIDQAKGRWLTFSFRGMAEDGFIVTGDALAMKIEFYSKKGSNYLDSVTRLIYREVEKDRRELAVNGNHKKGGAAVWRSYGLEELIPFGEVDAVKISVTYANGSSETPDHNSFYIDDFSLVQREVSLIGHTDPATQASPVSTLKPSDSKWIPLGGRWYYEPAPAESLSVTSGGKLSAPLKITEENADRLYYKDGRTTTPFAGNMTSWLRVGHLDAQGTKVTQDRFLPDSVTVVFKGDGFLTLTSRNIPNHPTAVFPDTFGTQGYNNNHIQELLRTYRLPLQPVPNPEAKVTDTENRNGALNMGPIGVAINGVVFYNPFDAGNQDASNMMDRCCGHPSPDNRYHYHKYPICVNTPFVDKGQTHSGMIGFAFDGIPIYGPYEEEGVMARDSTSNPLNGFNAHQDPVRGWHYHVTPGKFPYMIGGYFAKVESSNVESGPPRGAGGGRGPRPGGEDGPPDGDMDFPPPPRRPPPFRP